MPAVLVWSDWIRLCLHDRGPEAVLQVREVCGPNAVSMRPHLDGYRYSAFRASRTSDG